MEIKPLEKIHLILFDWGNTLMVDFPDEKGPMYQWKKVALVDGIEEILIYLHKKKYTLGIATNAGLSNAQDVLLALKRVNINQYFSYIFTSRDIGHKKQEPAFFETILNMVCLEPEACIMIGDSYEKDIISASKLGIHTVLFEPKPKTSHYPLAEYVVSDIRQLKNIL